MQTFLVGADHEIAHRRDAAIGDDENILARIDRAEEAWLAAQVFEDFRLVGQAVLGKTGQLGQLYLVDRVVTANQCEHEALLADQRHRLDRARQLEAHQLGDFFAGPLPGRFDLAQLFRWRGARRCRRQGLGHLRVGCIFGTVGECDRILAGIGQHVELVRSTAADGAGVGGHCAEFQAEPGEDARVRVVHRLVSLGHRLVADVEGVGVLHQEFARSHDAEARPDLVAELGLDLIEVHRQLLVAAQFLAREVGDHFLVRWAVRELGLLAVADLQQLAAEFLPASGFFPQLARLDRGHQHLDGAGAIHFLADDVLDLAQHAQAERRPGVQAGGELADHAGAQHQPMADDLGIAGGFLRGIQVELGQAHSAGFGRQRAPL